MTANGTKLTFRLTLDSCGDKASPMRRGTSATEGAWQNRGSPPRSNDETGSRQLIEQRLRSLQVERIEALGEPAVDRCEKIVGLLSFALIAPEARHTCRCAKFPGFSLLLARDRECALEIGCCFRRGRLRQ